MVTTASFSMLLKKKLQRCRKIEKLVIRDQNVPVDSSKLVDATKEINAYFLMRRDLAKVQ